MSEQPEFQYEISERLRELAMAFPETVEGSSCVNRAFSAGGKNFVFVGEKNGICTVRLKLADGWTKLEIDPEDPPGLSELESAMEESFGLLAPKRVQAQYAHH